MNSASNWLDLEGLSELTMWVNFDCQKCCLHSWRLLFPFCFFVAVVVDKPSVGLGPFFVHVCIFGSFAGSVGWSSDWFIRFRSRYCGNTKIEWQDSHRRTCGCVHVDYWRRHKLGFQEVEEPFFANFSGWLEQYFLFHELGGHSISTIGLCFGPKNSNQRPHFRMNKLRVAVIGAGAGGLVALRHLTTNLKLFAPVAYELSDRVGGTWVYTDSVGKDENGHPIHSSMYNSLR